MNHSNDAPLTTGQRASTPDTLELIHPMKLMIPDYLLCEILAYLDTFTLLTCRSVCRFWKCTTEDRTLLRHLLFTQPPPTGPHGNQKHREIINLHPVLRVLDYHFHTQVYFCNPTPPVGPLGERLDFRTSELAPATSDVMNNFATAPGVREVVLIMCGAERSVRREAGVRVWDLMLCFDDFIKDRHSQGNNMPAHYRLSWDHRQYPFAGFRVASVTSADQVTLMPEFHNISAVVRRISGFPLRKDALLVTFNGGEEDEAEEVDW